ncbi:uncharacterized protein METZ01_LOCUS208103 [marine metagenome]|uniref:Uncharacterized protein n=1 Tax=marine metagenome TaxID=408172 RepID=A0A382EXU4_9ZZZZ
MAKDAPNKYEPQPVALDSDEAGNALALLSRVVESTNNLDQYMSPKAPPMARLEVLKWASQVRNGAKLELEEATWRDSYFSVGVKCADHKTNPTTHFFYMAKGPEEKLQLIGVRN